MAFTLTVERTSVFPASRHEVFQLLQRLETLQYVAAPFASFEPVTSANEADAVSETKPFVWKAGNTSAYRFKLFGLIPFGTNAIHVIRFDEVAGILTHERNTHVPVWNHAIRLEALDGTHTRYTDSVEIGAGWKTIPVFLWAQLFYAHRQRKWIRMFTAGNDDRSR